MYAVTDGLSFQFCERSSSSRTCINLPSARAPIQFVEAVTLLKVKRDGPRYQQVKVFRAALYQAGRDDALGCEYSLFPSPLHFEKSLFICSSRERVASRSGVEG